MDENEMKRSGTAFWIGMLVGVIIGSVVSLLYAPKSGAETRAALKERAKDIRERFSKAKSKAGELKEKAEKNTEEMESEAKE